MNIDVVAFKDVNTNGDGFIPPSTGLASDALPEVQKSVLTANSDTGVPVRNVLSKTDLILCNRHDTDWVTLVCSSHYLWKRKKSIRLITSNGDTTFYPTFTTIKVVDGKRVEESRLPIFFTYETEEEIKSFVYDNANLPFLRFYYRHFHFSNKIEKEPLIVPNKQIESLFLICKADANNIVVSTDEVPEFQTGQKVRIIDGKSKGVIGVVARNQGQQRVGIVLDGLLTVATAYIPNTLLRYDILIKRNTHYETRNFIYDT